MKLSRRTNTIVLWIISIGLLVGMVIMFTPTLGLTTTQNETPTVMTVNGEEVSEFEISQARSASPMFSMVDEGPVADDLDLLLVDGVIRQEVLRQAAARQRVTNREVRDELDAFRERNGVEGSRNDDAYLRLVGNAGYTDQTFRDYLRQQLQVAAYQDEAIGEVDVTDAEIEAFYRVNQDAYRTESRVVARQIVTDDPEAAESLRERAQGGESFAELAAEASVERAEQGGAVGGDEPQPVGRPAFPTAVSGAVFSLSSPGLTPVVESAGRFHVVSVEEIVPAEPRPLNEVRDQVREDALAAKQQAALDAEIDELVLQADISFTDASDMAYDDSVVATVGDAEVHATDLVRATYGNPQIQQALSPETASLISEFFKPSILEQLVDRELAVQGADGLDATFFGSDALVAQSALDWVSRDAEVSDADVQTFYESNQERYTVPASAEVREVELADQDAAMTFRQAVLDGSDPAEAAAAAGATVEDLGTVREGDLEAPLDTAVFGTDGFEALPEDDGEVSDVLVIDREVEASDDAAADAEGDGAAVDADAGTADGDTEAAADASAEAENAEDAAADAASEDGSDAGADAEAGEGEAADDETATDAAADGGAAATEQAATEEVHVVLLADRTAERVRPLDEVRGDVEEVLLAQERQELQREWLASMRADTDVEVLLPSPAETAAEGAGAAGAAGESAVGDDAAGDDAVAEESATEDGGGADGAAGDEAAQDDAAQDDASQDDAAQDDAAQGDAAQGDAAQGDPAPDDAAEEDTAEDDAAN